MMYQQQYPHPLDGDNSTITSLSGGMGGGCGCGCGCGSSCGCGCGCEPNNNISSNINSISNSINNNNNVINKNNNNISNMGNMNSNSHNNPVPLTFSFSPSPAGGGGPSTLYFNGNNGNLDHSHGHQHSLSVLDGNNGPSMGQMQMHSPPPLPSHSRGGGCCSKNNNTAPSARVIQSSSLPHSNLSPSNVTSAVAAGSAIYNHNHNNNNNHLRKKIVDLSEEEVAMLLLDYFGCSLKATTSSSNSTSAGTSDGGSTKTETALPTRYKITGNDLFYVEEISDLKELGFADLPTVKLRRIVQDLKSWKQSGGFVPSEVLNVIQSTDVEVGDNQTISSEPTLPTQSESVFVPPVIVDNSTNHETEEIKEASVIANIVCRKKLVSEGFQLQFNEPNCCQLKAVNDKLHATQHQTGIDLTVLLLSQNRDFADLLYLLCEVMLKHFNTLKTCCDKAQISSICKVLFDQLSFRLADHSHASMVLKSLRIVVILSGVEQIVGLLTAEDYQVLANSLRSHMDSPDIISHVCGAIRLLGVKKESQVMMGSAGLGELLILVLKRHTNKVDFVKLIARALKYLASVGGNQIKLGECGGPAVVVEALTIHKANVVAVKQICGALWNISMPHNNKKLMHVAGACESLIDVLRIHQHNPLPLNQICGAIWTLSLYPPNRESFGSLGVCEVLVNILKEHKFNVQIVDQVCGAIGNLADFQENQKKLNDYGVCELLCELLRQHKSKREIAETACGAIWSMSESNSSVLYTTDTCQLLVTVLGEHALNAEVVRQASGALNKICCSVDLNKQLCRSLGIIEIIFGCLLTFPERADVCKQCLVCIGVFSADEDYKYFVENNLAGVLMQSLRFHLMNLDVAREVCVLLETLAAHVRYVAPLCAAGVCEALLAVLEIYKGEVDVVVKCLNVMKCVGARTIAQLDCDAIQPVLKLIDDLLFIYKMNQSVVPLLCWNMATFVCAGSRLDISSFGICSTVIDIMTIHMNSSDIILQACWVVSEFISCGQATAQKLCDEGIVQLLMQVALVHQQTPSIIKFVCSALNSLVAYTNPRICQLESHLVSPMIDTLLRKYYTNRSILKSLCGLIVHVAGSDSMSDGLQQQPNSKFAEVLLDALQFHTQDDEHICEDIKFALKSIQRSNCCIM